MLRTQVMTLHSGKGKCGSLLDAKKSWTSVALTPSLKFTFLNSLAFSVLLNGCKSWTRRPTVPMGQFQRLILVHHEKISHRLCFKHNSPPYCTYSMTDHFVKNCASQTTEMGEAPLEIPKVRPNTTFLSLGTIP